MTPPDHMLRAHPDRADEQRRALLYNDIDQFVEFARRVVVVGFPRGGAEGGEGEVDAEGAGGRGEKGFEFLDEGEQLGGRVAESADCAEAAGVGDGGAEGGGRGVRHAC